MTEYSLVYSTEAEKTYMVKDEETPREASRQYLTRIVIAMKTGDVGRMEDIYALLE